MPRHVSPLAVGLLLLSSAPKFVAVAGEGPPDRGAAAARVDHFEKAVRPLLTARCFGCHSASARSLKGGLRLDTPDGLARGGDGGPVVVPGDPDASPLIEAVRESDPLLRMPPDAPLAPREVEALVRWVRDGAVDLRQPSISTTPPTPATPAEDPKAWWSFQPIRDHEAPAVRAAGWPRNEIDRFLLARLEAEGLDPAPEADRRTLLRRLTFDLTGLPPTSAEVDRFLTDESPDAFERVVDRLLASPHHGERWGRHWLDVVRYADTAGCNGDFPVPEAYRYRNYVIDSLNRDTPYDRFLREQIAGDLLPSADERARRDAIIATGYLAISRRFSSVAEEFHLTIDDTIDNLGKAVLGLSVSCARCHDHKFDPIPTTDYYALYGIFQSTRYAFPGTEIYRHARDLVPLVTDAGQREELRPYLDQMAEIDAEIGRLYPQIEESDTGKSKDNLRARWESLKSRRDAILKGLPDYEKAYAVSEGTPIDARIQIKGDPKKLGDAVPRRFLTILGGPRVPADEPGSGRLQLADWLTAPDNPLTPRVIVNRIWQHHFGQGLVRSVNDFGTRGEPPTHPELLDHLAARFVREGWSIKALHRRIVTSSAYRMASTDDPDRARRDPDHRLLSRFSRRRLDAEEIRDAIRAVAGTLDRSPGRRHPFPPEWAWRYSQHKPFVDDYPTARRGVYLMQQRYRSQPFLATFDGADTNASTGERKASTTPQQALFALNSPFVAEQAEALAGRLGRDADEGPARVALAYRLVLGREPTATESDEALGFLDSVAQDLAGAGVPSGDRPRAGWVSLIRVLLGSNEFLFVD